jgi:anhydro-N-acetylmuramic acid kinase
MMLGKMYADAIVRFLDEFDLDSKSIEAIGLHGQTIWHESDGEFGFSMQLGKGSVVAAHCGIKTVCDFRSSDIANDGLGAPLAPAFHRYLFGSNNFCVVNIGGIANISVLGDKTIGYDIGCGNMLLDMWIQKHQNLAYDKDGNWAKSGKVDYKLVDLLLDDEYIKKSYPKSTGKEYFNLSWLDLKLQQLPYSITPEDVQASLLEFVAQTIANETLRFNPDILMLCGGGANNQALVDKIQQLIPNIQVATMQYANELEAMMMAWLAKERLESNPIDLCDITNAKKPTILGAIYE